MSLELQDLKDIWTICEMGSFRRAAEKLHITQPTLSSRVERMEKRLGAALFDRGRGHSRPTSLALMVAERATQLLADANSLTREVHRISRNESGTVRLGLGSAVSAVFLPEFILRVKRSLPAISLVCRSGSVEKLMRQLHRGEIDFAVCSGDPQLIRPEFKARRVINSEIVLATGRDHALVAEPPRTLEEIFSFPVAMPVIEPQYRHIALATYGVDLAEIPGVTYCSNFHVLERLAVEERFVVLAPKFAFDDLTGRGMLHTSPVPGGVKHEVFVFTNRTVLPIPAVGEVLQLLYGQARNLEERWKKFT